MPILTENFKMRPKHNWYSKIIRKYFKIRVNLTKLRRPIPDSDIREKVEKEKQLVIQIPFGGLGDHLIYSSLPELLWKQKGIKTLISDKSIFRSRAIPEFVWKLNPYVEFNSEKGWFIHRPLKNDYPTLDEYLQHLFNLEGDGHPKVYYKPKTISQLKGKTIVDPSFGASGKANGYFEPDFHRSVVAYIADNVGNFVLITHRHAHIRNELRNRIETVFKPAHYSVATIEQLADLLFSARARYLLYSGSASLSAALRLPSIVLCNRKAVPNFQYGINKYVDLMENK